MARDQERESRLSAVLQVDAPFVAALEHRHQQHEHEESPPPVPPVLAPHLRLCVDLGVGEGVHGERGTRSLGQQLGWVWNAMKQATSARDTPVLHLVGYEGRVRACVEREGSMGVGS